MLRSLFSAISGMRSQQTKLDVTGNNIANVATIGFKGSRVRFQDMLSQTTRSATAPMGGNAGTNPSQVGLGVAVGGIDDLHTQGNLMATNRLTDMAIQGSGFFVVSDGMRQLFTRDGAMGISLQNELYHSSSGMKVLGYTAIDGVIDTQKVPGPLTIPLGEQSMTRATRQIEMTGNLSNGAPLYHEHRNYVTVYDSKGEGYEIGITFTKTDVNEWTYNVPPSTDARVISSNIGTNSIYPNLNITQTTTGFTVGGRDGSVDWGFDAIDPATPNLVTFRHAVTDDTFVFNIESLTPGTTSSDFPVYSISGASDLLTFDEGGNPLVFGSDDYTLFVPGAAPIIFNIDFTSMKQVAGQSTALVKFQDGYPPGQLSTFSISNTGVITGIYSNGLIRDLGQIALAFFGNPEGLVKNSGNMYDVSANSGSPLIGAAGSDGRGSIETNMLEMSNVDLANEFTDMITTSRAFQANSRVVNTSDEMLQELINLKR